MVKYLPGVVDGSPRELYVRRIRPRFCEVGVIAEQMIVGILRSAAGMLVRGTLAPMVLTEEVVLHFVGNLSGRSELLPF